MSERLFVTFNAGSSTVKIGLFALTEAGPKRVGKGVIDFREPPLRFRLIEGPDTFDIALEAQPGDPLDSVLGEAFRRLSWHFDLGSVVAMGHRIVHGGDSFDGPVGVDDAVLEALEALVPLAPLHQPQGLGLIRAIRELRPELPQTASFDTAFHRTHAAIVRRFAIPRAMHDQGIRRYGFHGLSYRFIAGELARHEPTLAKGRVVVAHLGSGASLCAMRNLESVATTMGFSALDGLMMGTRTGALDPGAVLYLMEIEKLSLAEVGRVLYHESGLLGISGISSEPRVIVTHEGDDGESGERARIALDLFVRRVVREIGALVAVLGGLDLLVFTAGIGEHNAFIRTRVCAAFDYLGLRIDEAANTADAAVISTTDSAVRVGIEPTNEEWIAAHAAHDLLNA